MMSSLRGETTRRYTTFSTRTGFAPSRGTTVEGDKNHGHARVRR